MVFVSATASATELDTYCMVSARCMQVIFNFKFQPCRLRCVEDGPSARPLPLSKARRLGSTAMTLSR